MSRLLVSSCHPRYPRPSRGPRPGAGCASPRRRASSCGAQAPLTGTKSSSNHLVDRLSSTPTRPIYGPTGSLENSDVAHGTLTADEFGERLASDRHGVAGFESVNLALEPVAVHHRRRDSSAALIDEGEEKHRIVPDVGVRHS
jgi:hypothetical protein